MDSVRLSTPGDVRLGRPLRTATPRNTFHPLVCSELVGDPDARAGEAADLTLTVSRKKYGPLAAGHSLLAVVRRELDLVIDKRCQTSDWRRRPLSPQQERYAALDVEVLCLLRELFLPGHA